MRNLSFAPLAALVLLVLHGCVAPPALNGTKTTIATRSFASNRASHFGYQLSPDGKRLAWAGIRGTSMSVFIRDLGNGRTTAVNAKGLLAFRWSADGRQLLSDGMLAAGTEDHVLVAFDPARGAFKRLAGAKGAPVRLVGISLDSPGDLLIELGQRDPAFPDLYNLNSATGLLTSLEVNNGRIVSWLATPAGTLAGRIVRGNGNLALEIRQQDNNYRTVYSWDAKDNVNVVSISSDLTKSFLLSNHGTERVRLLAIDNITHALRVVHEDPDVDVAEVNIDPASGEPLLAFAEPDYPRSVVLDERLARVLRWLPAAGTPARLTIESADRYGSHMVVAVATDRGRSFYLIDLRQGQTELLRTSSTAGFEEALAPMRPIKLAARDGTVLHGYLTRPESTFGILPPLVLQVHGGPRSRTIWNYDSMTQFLANRGYAVLDVNFRGSTGYGRTLRDKGYGEWGKGMQTDLYDAVKWAVAHGYADPDRIAVLGTSYGGHAAVTALLDEPRMFSCGIAINSPLDMGDTFAQAPRQWLHDLPNLLPYLGVESAHDPRLAAHSLINRAASLSRPLLLVQGGRDGRVSPEQAVRFAAAAWRSGAPLTYWPVSGESHGFINWKSRLSLYRRTEQMLATCLGGRDAGFDYYEFASKLF